MTCEEINLREYLDQINFDKQFEKLVKKLKNKKVIIYGAGSLFKLIQEKYDLKQLNILGISDKYFTPDEKDTIKFEYRVIIRNEIPDFKPDYVLITTYQYINVIKGLESFFKNYVGKKCPKLLPVAKMPVSKLLYELILG